MDQTQKVEWILRIGVFGTFLGHGVFALMGEESWIPYFTAVGISQPTALVLLPLIGTLDVLIAVSTLFKPIKIILLWATLWGFITALIGSIVGEPIWEFVGATAQWTTPLALLYLKGYLKGLSKELKELWN